MGVQPDSTEIALAAQALTDLMPDLCTITRPTSAEDGYGGAPGASRTTVATGIHLLISPDYQREEELGNQQASVTKFALTFPPGTDVREGDFISVTTKDSIAYRVTNVRSPDSYDIAILASAIRYDNP